MKVKKIDRVLVNGQMSRSCVRQAFLLLVHICDFRTNVFILFLLKEVPLMVLNVGVVNSIIRACVCVYSFSGSFIFSVSYCLESFHIFKELLKLCYVTGAGCSQLP